MPSKVRAKLHLVNFDMPDQSITCLYPAAIIPTQSAIIRDFVALDSTVNGVVNFEVVIESEQILDYINEINAFIK